MLHTPSAMLHLALKNVTSYLKINCLTQRRVPPNAHIKKDKAARTSSGSLRGGTLIPFRHATPRSLSLIRSFLGLRHLVEFPLHMQHHIARHHIHVFLGASLGIDGVAHVLEIVEKVEAIEHEYQVALHGSV